MISLLITVATLLAQPEPPPPSLACAPDAMAADLHRPAIQSDLFMQPLCA